MLSYSAYIHILLGTFNNADIEGTQVCHIAVVLIYRLLCSLEKLATVFVHMIHRFCMLMVVSVSSVSSA